MAQVAVEEGGPQAAAESSSRASLAVKASYGAGQVGGQIFRDTPALLLPIYLTTVLGVPAWMAGVAILIPKAWIIFCDPLVGAWSDRANGHAGRGLFLAAGAILSGLSFVSLFATPVFARPLASALFTTLTFAIASTAFSFFSVPYLCLASELSPDPHERTEILAWRMVFSAVGLVLGASAQPLVAALGGGRHGFLSMSFIMAPICGVTMLAPGFAARRARAGRELSPSIGFIARLRLGARNRGFVRLAAAYTFQMLGQAVSYTVFGLYFIYIVRHLELMVPVMLVSAVTIIGAQPLWLALSRRWGKKPAYLLATLGWAAVNFSWLAAGPSTDVVARLPIIGTLSTQEILMLLRSFVLAIFNSGGVLLAFSMLTDTIDQDRAGPSGAQEGVFSGLFTAIEKASFAAGPALAGIVLSAMGFASSTHGVAAQSSRAIHSILIDLGALPGALVLISAPLVAALRLGADRNTAARRARVGECVPPIEERRTSGAGRPGYAIDE